MPEGDNVIRFPVQLRVVPMPTTAATITPVELVDHDGRLYPIDELLAALPRDTRDRLEQLGRNVCV